MVDMEQKPVIFVVKGLRLGVLGSDVVYVPGMVYRIDSREPHWRGTVWVWQDCTWYTSRSGLTWEHYYLYKNGKKIPVRRPLPISKEPVFEISDPRGGKLTNTEIYEESIKLCERVSEILSKRYPMDRYLLVDSCWECRVHYVVPERMYVSVLGEKVFEQGNLRVYELKGLPEKEIREKVYSKSVDTLEIFNHVIKGNMMVFGRRDLRRGHVEIIMGYDCIVMHPEHGVEKIPLEPNKFYLMFHPSPRIGQD